MLFAFISRMEGSPWGGSEELWSQAAARLRAMGHGVLASVVGWEGVRPPKLKELEDMGIEVSYRFPAKTPPIWQRVLRRISVNPSRDRKEDWAEALQVGSRTLY